ncbi:MAG TPA: UDP-N-acetylmuramoyl-L-alanine--D-glutamate ligase [Nitrospirota bacterium]|nr:UDP-N-acetylmuramoyl-L-alanine--D-glutamate ligase [Nitrospirota bacterium]
MNTARDINRFRGKNATVVGLARSGAGAANLLHKIGAVVTVTDSRPEAELKEHSSRLSEGIKKVFGSHPGELFSGADLVVVSPGVPLTIPPLMLAAESGVEMMGELELAWLYSDSPFIAVTGTNGKSTTTTLVGEMLAEAGMKVLVGGNLGNALTEEPQKLIGQDYIVAEVSSFQLEGTEGFRPKIAAILNITQDHLDRYAGMEEYAESKALVFRNQGPDDVLVLNADDGPTMALKDRASGRKIFFSRRRGLREGISVIEGNIVDGRVPGTRVKVLPVDEVRIKGVHNLENALAAAGVALAAGAPVPVVAKVLSEFPGLEHRLEFVRELGGVTYINDSKGTNVGAVEKSIESFDSPVILIAGGLDKHSDFAPLAQLIHGRVKKMILIGKAADVMEQALGSQTDTARAGSLKEAVELARRSANSGDVVLLSPACASFDMFRDFEDRGRQFKEIVKGLA